MQEKPSNKKRLRRKAGHRTWAAGNRPVPGGHRGDIMSPETRSKMMSRIKGKGTGPERIICEQLRLGGLSFDQHVTSLPGRPDIVFWQEKLAVFIDGDFWHGWRFPLWRHKLSEMWQKKIEATRERDQRNFRKLRQLGWKVMRIWEHRVERSPEECVKVILGIRQNRSVELWESDDLH